MLEGKDFKCLDMVFPFVSGYIDRISDYNDEVPLTEICTTYTTLMQDLLYDNKILGWSKDRLVTLVSKSEI